MSAEEKRVAETVSVAATKIVDADRLKRLEDTLVQSARKGDVALAKRLVKGNIPKRAHLNTLLGKTISIAASYGRVDYLRIFLLEGGVRLSEELATHLFVIALENASLDKEEIEELVQSMEEDYKVKTEHDCKVLAERGTKFLTEKDPKIFKEKTQALRESLIQTACFILNYCLQEKINIDLEKESQEGHTPLMLACAMNLELMVKKLLENGAKVNARAARTKVKSSWKGFTALHMVSNVGDNKSVNILRMLIDAGASEVLLEVSSRHPLFEATKFRAVYSLKILLDLTPNEALLHRYQSENHRRTGLLVHLVDAYVNHRKNDLLAAENSDFSFNVSEIKTQAENFVYRKDKNNELDEHEEIFDCIELLIKRVGKIIIEQQGVEAFRDIIELNYNQGSEYDARRIAIMDFLIQQGLPLEKRIDQSDQTLVELAHEHQQNITIGILVAAGANTHRLKLFLSKETELSVQDHTCLSQAYHIDVMFFRERLYSAKGSLAKIRMDKNWVDLQLELREEVFQAIGMGNVEQLIELILRGADINFGGPCFKDKKLGREHIKVGDVVYETLGITPLQFMLMQSKEIAIKMFIMLINCEFYAGEHIDIDSANLYSNTMYDQALRDLGFVWKGKAILRNHFLEYERKYYAKREEIEKGKFRDDAKTIITTLIVRQYEQAQGEVEKAFPVAAAPRNTPCIG